MKHKNTNKILPILAIETSGNLCSVAVLESENIYAESCVNKKNIHSEILFKLIENSLSKLELKITDINSVAVSEGPGSFTGLRIGMAAAKGIADGTGIPIIPVPTFDALALEISNYLGIDERFCIANKANRDEYYFTSFKKTKNGIITLHELTVADNEELLKYCSGMNNIFGNYNINEKIKITSPSALSIAQWAYINGNDFVNFEYDYLEPNYFKNFKVKVKK